MGKKFPSRHYLDPAERFILSLSRALSPRPIIVTLRPWLGRGYDDDDEEKEKEKKKEKGDDDLLSRRGS